jgi:hypothetical protein
MVVDESEVSTVLAVVASSALTAEARLTTPTAARPNVHLLNFIGSSSVVYLLLNTSIRTQTWGKNSLPRTNRVHLPELIGKSHRFDNKFFLSLFPRCLWRD